MLRILLTTTSYQDTPGDHHALLESQGYEIVRERGPLDEQRMLELAGEFDAFLCGDDALTGRVLERCLPRLRVISKYGIGLDKIDLKAAGRLGLPVLFTPGVNHTTVAEHTFCLLLALVRNLVESANATREGRWLRLTGHELWRKKIGIIGLGRIGEEVARRAHGFDMEIHGFGHYWPEAAAGQYGITRRETVEELLSACDIVSLHTKLTPDTHHLIHRERLALMPKGALLVNTSRGELVDPAAVVEALETGHLAGYATDVMEHEPPASDDPLLRHPKALVTAHIGSRTYESVPRQAMKATRNLIHYLNGEGDVHQANDVPLPAGSKVTLV